MYTLSKEKGVVDNRHNKFKEVEKIVLSLNGKPMYKSVESNEVIKFINVMIHHYRLCITSCADEEQYILQDKIESLVICRKQLNKSRKV